MLSIPVEKLYKDKNFDMFLELLTSKETLAKNISIPRIQKPGLALTGDISNLHPGRIQVLGKPELSYLEKLSKDKLKEIVNLICSIDIACFIITLDTEISQDFLDACEANKIPLFKTRLLTSTFVNRATRFLNENLTASTVVHGVLVDVFGVGILLKGESGIGKSECALDLVLRGHRLVSDDIVNVKKHPPSTLFGTGSDIIRHHMEIRGLGIINIRDLFGISAVRDQKVIELIVELLEWNPKVEYDRLGLDEKSMALLETNLPLVQIPVRPGRSLSAIIEVAARNFLMKKAGHHSAREFEEMLTKKIMSADDFAKGKMQLLE